MIHHWLDSRLHFLHLCLGDISLLMEQRVTVYLHGAFCLSKINEQFWCYCTFRDLKVNQGLPDSKATQVLRSVLNTSSGIRKLFSSHLCSIDHCFPLWLQGLPGPQGAIGLPGDKVGQHLIHRTDTICIIYCETSSCLCRTNCQLDKNFNKHKP